MILDTRLIQQYENAVNEWQALRTAGRERENEIQKASQLCQRVKAHLETCALSDDIKKSAIANLKDGRWYITVKNIACYPDAGYWFSPILVHVTEAGHFVQKELLTLEEQAA